MLFRLILFIVLLSLLIKRIPFSAATNLGKSETSIDRCLRKYRKSKLHERDSFESYFIYLQLGEYSAQIPTNSIVG